jgi:hypothetical protein
MRASFEFQCTECQNIFDVRLNLDLDGNYRIYCPICQHPHYRKIVGGKITDVRFPENEENILIEDIRPMKSSCRDKKTESPGMDNLLYDRWRQRLDVTEGAL